MISEQFLIEAFKGYDVPESIKQTSIDICTKYNIKGISDPMYISNVIANELGLGDGSHNFYKDVSIVGSIKKLSTRLTLSYGSNIKNSDELEHILINKLG